MSELERFVPRPLRWEAAADIRLFDRQEEIATITAPSGDATRESKAVVVEDIFRFFRDESVGGTLGLQRFYISDFKEQKAIFETRPAEATGRLRFQSGAEILWDRFGRHKFYWKVGRNKAVTYHLGDKEIRFEEDADAIVELDLATAFGLYLIHVLTI